MKKLVILFAYLLICLFAYSSPTLAAIEPLAKSADVPVTLCALETLFSNFVQMSAYLFGLTAFVAFLAGAFKYMTSGGDPKGTQTAQGTMTAAILGLILLVAAWLILKFVKDFTGVNVTVFSLPGCETTSTPPVSP